MGWEVGMRRVIAPDGRRWRVGRRWLPWRPRKRDIDLADIPIPPIDDGLLVALVIVVAGFVLGIVLSLLAIVVVFATEWLLVALIVPLAALWRLAWRKPWTVYAITGKRVVLRRAVGWSASKAMVVALAEEIEGRGRDETGPADA